MITNEPVFPLSEIALRLPTLGGKRIHTSTLWRWCLRGSRGIRLEHLRLGRRVLTSLAAVERFGLACASAGSVHRQIPVRRDQSRSAAVRDRAVADAAKTLDAAGI